MRIRKAGSLLVGVVLLGCAGCQPGPSVDTGAGGIGGRTSYGDLQETPVPDGVWRGHLLARCQRDEDLTVAERDLLRTCLEFFREGSGSDGMIEVEMRLAKGMDHPLVLLTLAQLYLMAGQGEPKLLPVEGPAADVGDWQRNKVRLLGRARALLAEVARSRPDDAAVDYLLADVARAEGDLAAADDLERRGFDKCTGGASFEILRQYQELGRYPAKLLAVPPPDYPEAALRKGLSGKVVLDLLLDPAGRVRQIVPVSSPGAMLTDAAVAAFGAGNYEAARLGKYPMWAWLRVTTTFNLADD